MLHRLTSVLLALWLAPAALGALSGQIDPAGGEQDGLESNPTTNVTTGVMSVEDFQAYLDAFGNTAFAGVFDMNATGGGLTVSEAGTSFSISSTTSVRTNRTDQLAVLATSETHHGFQELDATWTFNAPAGRRATHFGMAFLNWIDNATGVTMTANYSDGTSATLSADDAVASQDAWLGFVAPSFGSITSVTVNVEDGGSWTAFDDVAFVTQDIKSTTWVYDQSARIGSSGTAISNDGWTGGDLSNWVSQGFGGSQYLRNADDGDNTVTRVNDSEFSFDIPDKATEVVLEFDARTIGDGAERFFQAGLMDGGALRIGAGADFNNSNKYFIIDAAAVRHNSSVNITAGDNLSVFRLIIDMLANGGDGSGSLYVDDVLVVSGINMGLAGFNLSDLDGLYTRTNTRFAGPGTFVITASVPAPAALPAGLGLMGLMAIRRRRHR